MTCASTNRVTDTGFASSFIGSPLSRKSPDFFLGSPRMHENVLYLVNHAIVSGIQREIPSGTTFRNLRSARMEESCPDPLPKTADCGPSLPNRPSAHPSPKRCTRFCFTGTDTARPPPLPALGGLPSPPLPP